MTHAHDMQDLHWVMDLLMSIDAGILVVDRDYRIETWNGFMMNHTGLRPERVMGRSLFEVFPEIDAAWFQRKSEPVFALRCRVFLTWEQRPYLVRLGNYRSITGIAETMYQNVTLLPLQSITGEVKQMGIILYDVTDVAEAAAAWVKD